MKTIVINNPAAKESGALTILEQFLKKIYNSKRKSQFYCFVSVPSLKKYEKNNIKIIVLQKQNFINRIIWDNYGLKKYLKDNNIKPNIFVSLQNTAVNLDSSIIQILYYHQPLPLTNRKWSLLKKEERKYWFYKNIYPFFIKQYLKKVKKVIVQTNWVKDSFSKKFNYNTAKILVKKPKISLPKIENIKINKKSKFRIFYPAMPYVYKNHKMIVETLFELKEEILNFEEKVECIFTFSEKDSSELTKLIKDNELENIVILVGKISYERVMEYYRNSDLLLFPSYIETLGLPLLEGKHFNMNILAIDLPYSREVIDSYNKVRYFKDVGELKKYLLADLNNER